MKFKKKITSITSTSCLLQRVRGWKGTGSIQMWQSCLLGDRSAHTKLPMRGQRGPLWARVTAPRHGMVVRQFMLLPGSHVSGWKEVLGWSRGQKVPVPAQCLGESGRTDLGPLKQMLCSRFQLMFVIRIFSQMGTPQLLRTWLAQGRWLRQVVGLCGLCSFIQG